MDALLLVENPRAAVVEVLLPKLPGMRKSVSDQKMYMAIAIAMGLYHIPLDGQLAGCAAKDVLGCNVTIDVLPLLAALDDAVAYVKLGRKTRVEGS